MNKGMDKLFGSRMRARILGWFFAHVDEEFFVRQLAPILKEDPTNLSRELALLEDLGILVSSRKGNLKNFKVNKECSFYDDLRGLVLKTTGVVGQLKEGLAGIKGISLAFVYGSFAAGTERADSDVDLLVIGKIKLDILDEVLQTLEKRLGRTINYVVYSPKEFKEKFDGGDGFIRDVMKSRRIKLLGNINGYTTT